jgi:hypothetical protein
MHIEKKLKRWLFRGECKYPDACHAFVTLEEHRAPDGNYREITGCDDDGYIFGEILEPREKVKAYLSKIYRPIPEWQKQT